MYIFSHSLNQVDVMCLLDILLSPKIPYWEEILLVHPTPRAKNLCHVCPPYLPTCGISLPLQVNFSCAIFKIFKILLFVPLFLSPWGSSKKLVITCDRQGHFPPFTWWAWNSCTFKFAESWPRVPSPQNINSTFINISFTHCTWEISQTLASDKQRRKRNVLVPLWEPLSQV